MAKAKKERKPYRISSVAEAYTADAQIMPTLEEIRRAFGPAKTLGAPENVVTACDAQLEATGAYTLLQHSFDLGQFPQTSFLGYSTLQQISQNGMVRACIETVADDIMRNFIELKREGQSDKAPDKKEGGEQEFARILAEALGEEDKPAEKDDAADESLNRLDEELRALRIRQVLHEAVTLVGYMGGALVYIDTGEVDPEILKMPLNISKASAELKKERRLRFVAIDPINIFPGTYNSISPLRPDYYKPRSWWVMGQEIHASRLIRLVANEVPTLLKPSYNFMGIAQAQILWDYVMHFETNRDAVNRMLNKFSLTVMKTDMAEVLTQAGGLDELNKRINLLVRFRSNDGVQLIDKEAEDILKLETPIGGMTDVVRQSLEILAGINRTPAVKLLGISPSGFNATGQSDIRNYYDHIASQQNKILRAAIEKILNILQIRLFGEIDRTITFDFVPLGEEDKAAQASTQKTRADTMAVLLDRQIVSPEECRKILADDPDSGFSDIDVDELPEPPQQEGMQEQMAGLAGLVGNEQEAPKPEIDDVDKAGMVGDAKPEDIIGWYSLNGKRLPITKRDIQKPHQAIAEPELSEAERMALKNYTGPAFAKFNREAREYGDTIAVQMMDNILARSQTTKPIVVFRGEHDDLSTLKSGKGFLSTTTDFDQAVKYAGENGGRLYEIHVPKGYSAISLLPYSLNKVESEILLPRGNQVKTVGFRKIGDKEVEVVELAGNEFAEDDAHWITVHPNGEENDGQPVLVDGEKGNYTVVGGLGGKFNGKKMSEVCNTAVKTSTSEETKLSELEGSEKQIAWGKEIRQRELESALAKKYPQYKKYLSDIKSAKMFIDNKDENGLYKLFSIHSGLDALEKDFTQLSEEEKMQRLAKILYIAGAGGFITKYPKSYARWKALKGDRNVRKWINENKYFSKLDGEKFSENLELWLSLGIDKPKGQDKAQDEILGMDEPHWITIHPNGPREKGQPILVDGEKGNYTVLGGMGGQFNGQKMQDVVKAGQSKEAWKADYDPWDFLDDDNGGEKKAEAQGKKPLSEMTLADLPENIKKAIEAHSKILHETPEDYFKLVAGQSKEALKDEAEYWSKHAEEGDSAKHQAAIYAYILEQKTGESAQPIAEVKEPEEKKPFESLKVEDLPDDIKGSVKKLAELSGFDPEEYFNLFKENSEDVLKGKIADYKEEPTEVKKGMSEISAFILKEKYGTEVEEPAAEQPTAATKEEPSAEPKAPSQLSFAELPTDIQDAMQKMAKGTGETPEGLWDEIKGFPADEIQKELGIVKNQASHEGLSESTMAEVKAEKAVWSFLAGQKEEAEQQQKPISEIKYEDLPGDIKDAVNIIADFSHKSPEEQWVIFKGQGDEQLKKNTSLPPWFLHKNEFEKISQYVLAKKGISVAQAQSTAQTAAFEKPQQASPAFEEPANPFASSASSAKSGKELSAYQVKKHSDFVKKFQPDVPGATVEVKEDGQIYINGTPSFSADGLYKKTAFASAKQIKGMMDSIKESEDASTPEGQAQLSYLKKLYQERKKQAWAKAPTKLSASLEKLKAQPSVESIVGDIAKTMPGVSIKGESVYVDGHYLDRHDLVMNNAYKTSEDLADQIKGIEKRLAAGEKNKELEFHLAFKKAVLAAKQGNPQVTSAELKKEHPAYDSSEATEDAMRGYAVHDMLGRPKANKAQVKDYTSHYDRYMNGLLRSKNGYLAPADTVDRIHTFDKLMAESRLQEPVVLYRGLKFDKLEQAGLDPKKMFAKGGVYPDDGFESTSTKVGVADGFAGAPGQGVILKLLVPSGVGAVSALKDTHYPHEHEVILDRGLRWRTVGETYEQGYPVKIMELVGNTGDSNE